MYAKDPTIGSLLYSLSNQRGTINKTQLAQIVANALKPMVEQRKITIQEIKIPRLVLGNISIEINCTDTSGEQIHFVLNAVIQNEKFREDIGGTKGIQLVLFSLIILEVQKTKNEQLHNKSSCGR